MTLALGLLFVGALVAFATWHSVSSPQAKQQQTVRRDQDSQLVCPHCGQQGHVSSRVVTRKVGVSGGKATGALLTGGVSMLATGLSRKQRMTRMFCASCGTGWDVA